MKMMTRVRRAIVIAPSVLVAAGVISIACRDATAPERLAVGDPLFGGKKEPPPPPPPKFRLTGGGRVDARNPAPEGPHSPTETEKSTPETRDFATFGFQARPPGSGNITWVEHNPAQAFTFHGTVNSFASAASGVGETCGTFSGTGRLRTRAGFTGDATFVVHHACDVEEPGRSDHISITITSGDFTYHRHALLSGGNIQEHKA